MAKRRKKPYRVHSPEKKAAAVRRTLDGERVCDVAAEIKVVPVLLSRWRSDPEINRAARALGGKAKGTRRVAAKSVLPTTRRASPKRAKPLRAVAFACPHCDGPISRGDA